MKLLSTFTFLFISTFLLSQPTRNLVGYYSMNSDRAIDEGITPNPEGIVNGSPINACGINGQSLQFDGVDDEIIFEGDWAGHLDGDFTISFHMLPDPAPGLQEIMSFVDTCSGNSFFNILYNRASNNVIANISDEANINISLFGDLDPNTCWQHIILRREQGRVEFFVNNRLEGTDASPTRIPFQDSAVFRISGGPCIDAGLFSRYQGRLDELRVYNRLVTIEEFQSLGFNEDEILTPDTTILDGASVQIRTSTTCASS
ncbi:MAG: LamG-like jellyroll fold domain-containing protein, partial [Bacteroidota bacterium]